MNALCKREIMKWYLAGLNTMWPLRWQNGGFRRPMSPHFLITISEKLHLNICGRRVSTPLTCIFQKDAWGCIFWRKGRCKGLQRLFTIVFIRHFLYSTRQEWIGTLSLMAWIGFIGRV